MFCKRHQHSFTHSKVAVEDFKKLTIYEVGLLLDAAQYP